MADDLSISLREYLDQRFTQLHEAIDLARTTHNHIHQLESEAVSRATTVLDHRLTEMNEFRAQLSEERRLYITRPMFDAWESSLVIRFESRLALVEGRLTTLERAESGARGSLWALGGVWVVITVVINVVLYLWGKA